MYHEAHYHKSALDLICKLQKNCEYDVLFLNFFMFRFIMKVNFENMEDMIFLRSFSENLGGV
jgi:hypothetical protein